MAQLGPQLMGVVLIAAVVFGLSLLFWLVTKVITKGIRVTEEEEIDGLDIGEHGNVAYPDFQGSSVFTASGAASGHRAGAPVPGMARSSSCPPGGYKRQGGGRSIRPRPAPRNPRPAGRGVLAPLAGMSSAVRGMKRWPSDV